MTASASSPQPKHLWPVSALLPLEKYSSKTGETNCDSFISRKCDRSQGVLIDSVSDLVKIAFVFTLLSWFRQIGLHENSDLIPWRVQRDQLNLFCARTWSDVPVIYNVTKAFASPRDFASHRCTGPCLARQTKLKFLKHLRASINYGFENYFSHKKKSVPIVLNRFW